MSAPAAATTTAAPSVVRPSSDGSASRAGGTRGRHRVGAGPVVSQSAVALDDRAGGNGYAAGRPQGDGDAGKYRHEPPWALDRRAAHVVEHEERAEQHGRTDHPHRRPAGPAADDQHEPESDVHEDAEAVEEGEHDEGQPGPHGVDAEGRVARSRATPPRTGVPAGGSGLGVGVGGGSS